MSFYPKPLDDLINELKKMPGIGPKSAQRLAFYILETSEKDVEALKNAITNVKKSIKYCTECFNLAAGDKCQICSDPTRNSKVICVVSEPKDMIAIERTNEYRGLYHILGGVISPLDGIGPDQLRIKELISRLKSGVEEVILALNPTTESEATVFYLTKLIKPLGIKLTRIAYGLPIGCDMDFADEATITKSLEGRSLL